MASSVLPLSVCFGCGLCTSSYCAYVWYFAYLVRASAFHHSLAPCRPRARTNKTKKRSEEKTTRNKLSLSRSVVSSVRKRDRVGELPIQFCTYLFAILPQKWKWQRLTGSTLAIHAYCCCLRRMLPLLGSAATLCRYYCYDHLWCIYRIAIDAIWVLNIQYHEHMHDKFSAVSISAPSLLSISSSRCTRVHNPPVWLRLLHPVRRPSAHTRCPIRVWVFEINHKLFEIRCAK